MSMSVWWMGTYSMLLPKAAFFHRKYFDLYTYAMPSSIRDYVTRERNCEDIAMSLLVANATGEPLIWMKVKIYELGSSRISSLKRHSKSGNKCLNDLISLFGRIPLVQSNVKAVDARAMTEGCGCSLQEDLLWVRGSCDNMSVLVVSLNRSKREGKAEIQVLGMQAIQLFGEVAVVIQG